MDTRMRELKSKKYRIIPRFVALAPSDKIFLALSHAFLLISSYGPFLAEILVDIIFFFSHKKTGNIAN